MGGADVRAFITHDGEGNITSLVVPASDLKEGDIELVEATTSGGESLRIAEVQLAKSADPADVSNTHKLDAKTRKLVRKK